MEKWMNLWEQIVTWKLVRPKQMQTNKLVYNKDRIARIKLLKACKGIHISTVKPPTTAESKMKAEKRSEWRLLPSNPRIDYERERDRESMCTYARVCMYVRTYVGLWMRVCYGLCRVSISASNAYCLPILFLQTSFCIGQSQLDLHLLLGLPIFYRFEETFC